MVSVYVWPLTSMFYYMEPWSERGFHDIVHGLPMVGHVQYARMSVDVRKKK